MSDLSFKIDIPTPDEIAAKIDAFVLPRVAQAVSNIANKVQFDWKQAINNAKLWDQEKKAYMASITINMVTPMHAIVSSDYKYAEEIETGRPAKDLKKALLTSNKVRFVKNGKNAGQRYLISPFRHNTEGNTALAPAMPSNVNKMAKMLSQSEVKKKHLVHNGGTGSNAKMIMRSKYKWGESLPAGLAPKKAEHHKTDIYAGMVRMKTATGGSSYLTFRVMGEWSSGWIVPPQPGQYIAKQVAENIQPVVNLVIQEAFKRDFSG